MKNKDTKSRRKEHSDKDLKFMNACYEKITKYFPFNSYSSGKYDHLILMQDLMKAFPQFEITGDKNTKKAYWYGVLCGYYTCLQNESDNVMKREAIKDFENGRRPS